MNSVLLIGRLTRDPDMRYTSNTQMAIASFTLAVDRDGRDKGTDFPQVKAFGRTAENMEKYVKKGCKVAVMGRLQTGSYKNKDGQTVYTTDVIADRVEFIDRPKKAAETGDSAAEAGFAVLEEEVPF